MANSWPLTADDAAEGDWFGDSVAIDGGTVVVGAQQQRRRRRDLGNWYRSCLRLPQGHAGHVQPSGQAEILRRWAD